MLNYTHLGTDFHASIIEAREDGTLVVSSSEFDQNATGTPQEIARLFGISVTAVRKAIAAFRAG